MYIRSMSITKLKIRNLMSHTKYIKITIREIHRRFRFYVCHRLFVGSDLL